MNKATEVYKYKIEQAIEQIIDLVEGSSEAQLYWKPSEEEWSLMEVLSHVEEVLDYWVGELQRVIASPGKAWGRGFDAPARLEAIKEAHSRTYSSVIAGINTIKDHTSAVFSEIKSEDLEIEAPHRNPKFGTKNMYFLVDHFLVEHLEKHITQIKRVQQQYKESRVNS